MYLLPADTRGYSNDDLDSELRTTRVSIKPQEEPKPPEDKDNKDNKSSGGTGTKMALEEGKMGKKDSDKKAGQYQIQKVENVDPTLAKEQRDETRPHRRHPGRAEGPAGRRVRVADGDRRFLRRARRPRHPGRPDRQRAG